jgi:hypothetical protein
VSQQVNPPSSRAPIIQLTDAESSPTSPSPTKATFKYTWIPPPETEHDFRIKAIKTYTAAAKTFMINTGMNKEWKMLDEHAHGHDSWLSRYG